MKECEQLKTMFEGSRTLQTDMEVDLDEAESKVNGFVMVHKEMDICFEMSHKYQATVGPE